MDKQVRVGIIGYGMAGQVFHAPIITSVPGLKLTSVVERHDEKSKERYPWVKVVKDVEALFEDSTIDLVVVTTPNHLHYDMAKRALLAGKHVVVEKAFTITSQEAQELIDLAEEKKKVLSINQNRRWDGDFQTVQKILKEDLLGDIVEYEAHFDRFRDYLKPGAWKERDVIGSGILYDLGPHLIDQALCLFGLPKYITADLRKQRPVSKVTDYFEVVLDYGKLKVILKAGMLVKEKGPHFILHGTKGSFIKYGMDPQEEVLKKGGSPLDAGWGIEAKEQWGKINTQIKGLHYEGLVETLPGRYQDFYENIYKAILGEEDLIVKPEQAKQTMKIIELAIKSHKEKRTIDVSQ